MNLNQHKARCFGHSIGRFALTLFMLLLACDNYIIERSASEYFPYREGNWWRYSNNSLYDPKTILTEVEQLDTLLQIECYPVSFSGDVKYLAKTDDAIDQYINITHFVAGNEYTILKGFIKRIELPLVQGNAYHDMLTDSLYLFGNWIKGKYEINGLVSRYENDKSYGEIYKVILTTTEMLVLSDTTIINTTNLEEYYAPDIGLVKFNDGEDEYHLLDYEIK